MTGHLAYVLTTTPTILVPSSLILIGIELKPYAMLLNLPIGCEADRLWHSLPIADVRQVAAIWGKAEESQMSQKRR
jgi:hypothetical protein